MSDQLRTLAEAEATERYGEKRRGFDLLPVDYVRGGKKDGFIDGFIAGRTSVTHADIERVILGRTATTAARMIVEEYNAGRLFK